MYRKSKKLLVWCLVVSMVLTQMLFTNIALAATPNAGANRYETAAKVALAGWTTSDYAVLAYGEAFPDALAAAPLAAAYGAPILLTNNDKLDTYTKDALTKLGVKNVIIVGGTGAVPAAVEAEVAAMPGMTVLPRVAGTDRIGTALAIAKAVEAKTGVAAADVFVVNSESYADALSISSLAAIAPISTIVLVDTNAVNADVAAYVGSKKAYAIGGTGVISDAVVSQLKAERVTEGTDRYGTNLAVLKTFADFKFDKVFVATGENYPDALAGSVYAAKFGSPLVLVDQAITTATMDFLKTKMTASSTVYTLGGLATVASAASALETTVNPPSTTLAVESVSVLSNSAFQVKFNKAVDKSSAQLVTNYKFDGGALPVNTYAYLESDNQTVTFFLGTTQDQDKKVALTVKDVMQKDVFAKVAQYDTTLTFRDTANPTLQKIEVRDGNKTLRLTFSEPVNGGGTTALVADTYKIDGNALTTYGNTGGLDWKSILTTKDDYRVVDIPFATAIPAGSHTLTVRNTSAFKVIDSANLAVTEANMAFTAVDDTTGPKVVSTEATKGTNGTITITFDEDLGAIVDGWKCNGADVTEAYKVVDGSTKYNIITFSAEVFEGANILLIPKDQTDKFGNKIGTEDLRLSVTGVKDTVAPTVTGINAVSDKEIRISFSESVNVGSYATTKANFTIKDSSGSTKYSSTKDAALYQLENPVDSDNKVVKVTFTNALPGSQYTIEIKDLRDGSDNVMAPYSGSFTVPDKTNPTLATSGSKAVIKSPTIEVFFSEAMDAASILNKANYLYKTTGNFVALPSSVTLEAGTNNKSVKLTFPDSIGAANVTDITVLGVTDVSGNMLNNGSQTTGAPAATTGVSAKIVDGTAKISGDTSKVWIEFETDKQLTSISPADFGAGFLSVGAATADIATVTGKVVKLTYNADAAEVSSLKAAGKTITLNTAWNTAAQTNATKTEQGDALITEVPTDDGAINVTDYVAPLYSDIAILGAKSAKVVMNENVGKGNLEALKDDFTFESNGQVLTVDTVDVSTTDITYTFKEYIVTSLKVTPKATLDVKDSAGNAYVPTTDDKKGYTKNVGAIAALVGASFADAIGLANDGKTQITLPAAGAGDSFVYMISSGAGAVATPALYADLSSWTAVTDGATITAADGKHIGIAEVDAYARAIKFVDLTAVTTAFVAGTAQVETATVVLNAAADGIVNATVTAAGMTGTTKTVNVAVLAADNAAAIATKVRTALSADANVSAFFTVGGAGADVVLTAKAAAANDITMNVAIVNNGGGAIVTDAANSANTTAGVANAN